ncbi:MAG TPA: sulfate adenylyltransferase subunit CysN [Terracidiphilus sp.]|nr:sulfate adenylyltransferase subunit CysN [Terracidiphilus sp.]
MAVATELENRRFEIGDFLAQEREKDLLRFSTAGSVDDGKSTLIGRLLYDTQSVYEDQVRSIEGKGTAAPGQIDFALLTDGLRAEREQGITIDVAYRYFSTAKRKFIIADTPGHEQYTRNMATGASTADAAIVLIDASKGVQIQSRRHAYIASLLRVRHVLVAVNKMDLIGYDAAVFRSIESEFRAVLEQIAEDTGTQAVAYFVPVSALRGDNVVHQAAGPSSAMPWYEGPSLLELLEALPAANTTHSAAFRFPVQRVLRPDHSFRGFAGQIASGVVRVGDRITVFPSGREARIERIVTFDGDLNEAVAPLSVTLVLDRELDISRGDLIAGAGETPVVARSVTASLVWMDQRPLDAHRRYLLKHTSHTVPAVVSSVDHRVNLSAFQHEPAPTLRMNDIGAVSLHLLRSIAVDLYRDNRSTGALILIDPETNATVAAGMVTAAQGQAVAGEEDEIAAWGRVTAGEREARWGHRGGVLELTGPGELIDAVERSLFAMGAVACRIDAGEQAFRENAHLLDVVSDLETQSGLIALVVRKEEAAVLTASSGGFEIALDADNRMRAVTEVHQLLRRAGIFISSEGADL